MTATRPNRFGKGPCSCCGYHTLDEAAGGIAYAVQPGRDAAAERSAAWERIVSISQLVAFRREDLPSTSALEDAARALRFDLRLDPTDLSTESGFIPATLDGRTAGFEWFLSPSSDHPDHAEAIGDRDVVAELVTHSDETEAQSAMVCAAALLTLTRGVYFDEYGNVYTAPEPVVKEVRAWIAGELEPGSPPTPGSTERSGLHRLFRRMFRR